MKDGLGSDGGGPFSLAFLESDTNKVWASREVSAHVLTLPDWGGHLECSVWTDPETALLLLLLSILLGELLL